MMSYTPDDELLTPSIETILKGIRDFREATVCRLNSSDYSTGHMSEINNLSMQLLKYEVDLIKLSNTVR